MLATLTTDATWVVIAIVAAYLAFLGGMIGLWRLGVAAKHWQEQSLRRSVPPSSEPDPPDSVAAERWRNMSEADRSYLLRRRYPPPGADPPDAPRA